MPTAQRFEDLEVWRDARELVKQVYALTAKFPKHETFGLASQMQRAAVSVMSNIAEGFERGGNAEFVQFLYVARASCGELRSQSYVVSDLNYVSEAEAQEIRKRCESISRRLKALADYLKHSGMKGVKFHDERTAYSVEIEP